MASIFGGRMALLLLLLYSVVTLTTSLGSIGANLGIVLPPSAPNVPQAPQMPDCSKAGNPGSPEWDKCWKTFNTKMKEFRSEMKHFGKNVRNHNRKINQYRRKHLPGAKNPQNSMVTMNLNNYKVQSNNFGILGSGSVGKVQITVNIGKFGSMKISDDGARTMKWECFNEDKSSGWVTVRVPKHVDLSSVKFETKNQQLIITGPTKTTKASVSLNAPPNLDKIAADLDPFPDLIF